MSGNVTESDVVAAYEAAKRLEEFVRTLKYISTSPDVPEAVRRDQFDEWLNYLTDEFDLAWPAIEIVLPVLQSSQFARFGFDVHPSMHVAIANCADHLRRKPSKPDSSKPATDGFIKCVGTIALPAFDETDALLWIERQATLAVLGTSPSGEAGQRLADNDNGQKPHGGRVKPKRGRPKGSAKNPKQDKRLAEAWKSGQYKKKTDVDDAFGLPHGTTHSAFDRYRKKPN